jgi:hypothetical protein
LWRRRGLVAGTGLTESPGAEKMGGVRARPILAVLVVALVASACSSSSDGGSAATTTLARPAMRAIMASTDLYVGAPQRVAVGLPLDDGRLVSFGTVRFRFSFLGTSEASSAPGATATATYIPTPGTPAGDGTTEITQPAAGRGVFEAENVRFDRSGSWQVEVTAQVAGAGTKRATVAFPVADAPALPAPGQPALRTDNLTIRSKHVPIGAIDSRAITAGKVPDPELHRWTIAEALRQHRPILAVFATPVYCVSQFCGPVTDAVDALWRRYRDRAVFIHVEIWRDYNAQPPQINEAAADWLLRNNDLTEPWLYLIGADGTILDRWSSLFDPAEVARELQHLPPMR